ncbi:MAG TPA: ribosome maturation factor RimM [Bryobacteraceae bacterium]|jgi:16S rRNA processing protein RimM|nr:ribosome maturation factor RimM [Bryobacteraceae bacterium]
MTPEWVTIAILGKPRGNRGEITAVSLSSHPERFATLPGVHLFGSADPVASMGKNALEIERVWEHEGTLIFKFRGIDSISDAEKLRGAEVRIPGSERASADEGEFYHSDLIGCEVRERATGRRVGKVTGVEEYGGPALLAIDNGRVLIPFVRAICVEIRPEDRLILADLPEGLEHLDSPG